MILVTGATGVIGRALIKRLHAERLPCAVLSRDVLVDPVALANVSLRKPSVLVHLAAVVPQPPVIPDDETSAALTRNLDQRVLKAISRWNCHVVYASGCSLYPKGDKTPKCEDEAGAEQITSSAYLASKQQGERDFLASGKATVLRISAPIGEGLPQATVLGRFIEAAKARGELEVWGTGQREQNYVDVADIADALLRAMILRPGKLINIAANQPITMLDLAKQTVEVFGGGVVRMLDKLDPKDGVSARYSNQRALDLLGWRPLTSFRVSLQRIAEVVL